MKKPINTQMALIDNTTYTGTDALGFYTKALLGGDFLSLINILSDVKSKEKLARLDMANILQLADCTFTDGGTTTLSQKTIEVCPIKVNKEFCIRDFEVNYLSEQLRAGSNDAQVPATFQDYILNLIALNIKNDLDNMAINGDTSASPATICNGFRKLWAADSAIVSVTGTTLSAANIIAEIGKVYQAIPNTIANRGDVKIFLSPAGIKFYKQALAALNNALVGSYNNGDFTLMYIDIPVVEVKHLPTNEMFAAEPLNLWYGTDLVSDQEDVKIINMLETTGSPNMRFLAHFKFGVQYGISEEIVWYH